MAVADLEQLEHERLLADREKPSIGGSAAATITLEAAGEVPPYGRSAFDEWVRLTGRKTTPDLDNDHFEVGRLMEEPIATRFTRRTGIELAKVPLLIHPKYDWITGHMDRASVSGAPPADVEIKLVEFDRDGEWSDPNLGEAQRVPLSHLLQPVWYVGIPRPKRSPMIDVSNGLLGAFSRRIYIAAQIGMFRPLRIYSWEPDETIRAIHARMFEVCQRFWEEYVQKDSPPPMPQRNVPAARRWLDTVYPALPKGDLPDGGAKLVELARAYQEALDQENAAKAKKEQVGVDLRALMGEAKTATGEADGISAKVTMVAVREVTDTDFEGVVRDLGVDVPADLIVKNQKTTRAAYRYPRITLRGGSTDNQKKET